MQAKELILSGLVLSLLGGEALASQYFLYTPTPASVDQVAEKGSEAVAVREITVVRGDSLFRISRRNSGRGSYYPQILLFNKIANPDLIYPGQKLRIPLKPGRKITPEVKPATMAPLTMTPAPPTAPSGPRPQPEPTVAAPPPEEIRAATPVTVSPPATLETAEQALYAKGVSSYKAGNCRQAIKSFDRLLADNPDSPLAADASLYRADCYLQLAGQ